jgi:hypothetical protein
MAKKLIDRIKDSLAKEGMTVRTNAARDWLRAKVKNLRPSRNDMLNDRNRQKVRSIVGKMYFYFYNPKTADKLEYYDTFPLVIPIEMYPDGFLGLNLHYIHPKYRMVLLDKLSDTLTNDRYDEKTKFRISYDYLRSASKAFEATPCIKRYLFNHVESRFLEISADEWDIAAMLPVESFVKKSQVQVWAESKKKF